MKGKTYTRKDIKEHKTFDKGIWVAYKENVYDITEFLKVHPGGSDKVMMASGYFLEPFFEQYPHHKREDVQMLLKNYWIGYMDPEEQMKPEEIPDWSEMQKQDLERSQNLVQLQQFPFCAEANSNILDQFITPGDQQFVRNHYLVPRIDIEDYELEILEGKNEIHTYMFDDLKQYKEIEQVVSFSCGGNRRKQLQDKYSDIKGLSWNVGAIGNSVYTGVRVRDILIDKIGAQICDENYYKDKHLIVSGMDTDFQNYPFQISIPLNLVVQKDSKVMLAYKLNGSQIPLDHGYPVRFVVPGSIGVRNVKWVNKLTISSNEAQTAMQQRDYKYIQERDWTKFKFEDYDALLYNVINSAITYPKDQESIQANENGQIVIKGYAIGDGKTGTPIENVEVSFDQGLNWTKAQIIHKENIQDKVYSWVLWEYQINVQSGNNISVMVKCTDKNGKTQDKKLEEQYNIKGLLNNAPHLIQFTVL